MDSHPSLSQVKLTAWLAASHLAAGLIAVALLLGLPRLGLSSPAALALAALGAAVAGLLLSTPLRRAAEMAAAALAQLSRGQPTAPLPTGWRYGPLHDLLQQVDAVAGREREVAALRQDLLRRTGETAAQAERNRLARDLHDSIKQQIYAINVSAAAALARWDTDPAAARTAVEDVRRGAQAAMAEMAALLQQLRPAPLAAAGLLDALREQGEALAYRTGAEVTVDLGQPGEATTYVSSLGAQRLPAGAEEAIFRIAQEALANVARHARAAHVTLRLRVEHNTLRLEIVDDGQGFRPSEIDGAGAAQGGEERQFRAGYGLASMRDRAEAIGGRLEVVSQPGGGTRVVLSLPLTQPAAAPETTMSAEVKALLRTASAAHWIAGAATVLTLVVALGMIPRLAGGGLEQAPMLINVVLILAGMATAVVAWSRSRRAALGVDLVLGADSPAVLRLRREQHSRQMWLCLASVLLLPAALIPQDWPQFPLPALAIGLLCALLAGLAVARTCRAAEAYWRRLPAGPLAAELEQAWSQRFTPLLVLAITIPGYLFLRFGGAPAPLAWPPSRELLIDILATLYLSLLLVWSVVTYAQLRHWRGLSDGNQEDKGGV